MDIRNCQNVNLNVGVICPKCKTQNKITGAYDFDANGNPTLLDGLKSLSKTELLSLLNVANITRDKEYSKREFIENLNTFDNRVVAVIIEELNKSNNFKMFILVLITCISMTINFKKNTFTEIQPLIKSKIENSIQQSSEKKTLKDYNEADSALYKARRAHKNHQRKK